MTNSQVQLGSSLDHLEDNLLLAIAEGRSPTVAKLASAYVAIVKEFLTSLGAHSEPYNRERALKEMHSIGGGWDEIRWIQDDTRHVIERGLQSNDREIALETVFLPIRIADVGRESRDYFIFAGFLSFMPYAYSQVKAVTCPDHIRDAVLPRISRYLKERLDLYIWSEIARTDDEQILVALENLADAVLLTFNQLLKEAYDQRDREFTHRIITEMDDALQVYVQRYGLRNPRRADNAALQRANSTRTLVTRSRVIRFGLIGWVLHELLEGRIGTDDAKSWYRSLRQEQLSLSDLWETFLSATAAQWETELGWSFWESSEERDRTLYAPQIDHYLQYSFIIQAVDRLNRVRQSARGPLRPAEELDSLWGSTEAPLKQRIDEIRDTWQIFSGLVVGGNRTLEDLESSLNEARARWEEHQRREIANALIADNAVERFLRATAQGWQETAHLSLLIRSLGQENIVDRLPASTISVGVRAPKELFIEEEDNPPSLFGWDFGRYLAMRETDHILGKIRGIATPDGTDRDNLPTRVARSLNEEMKQAEDAVIVASWEAIELLMDDPRWVDDFNHHEGEIATLGLFERARVYRTESQGVHALVVDLKKLGSLDRAMPEEGRVDAVSGIQIMLDDPAPPRPSEPEQARANHRSSRPEVLVRLHVDVQYNISTPEVARWIGDDPTLANHPAK